MQETDGISARCEKEQRLQTADENHGNEFDVKCEKMRGVERAENVKRETPTENPVPEFRLSFCANRTAAGK